MCACVYIFESLFLRQFAMDLVPFIKLVHTPLIHEYGEIMVVTSVYVLLIRASMDTSLPGTNNII